MVRFAFVVNGRAELWEARGNDVRAAAARLVNRVFDEYGDFPAAYICQRADAAQEDEQALLMRVKRNARFAR